MQYSFLSADYEVAACDRVIQLYGNYQRLRDIVREKSGKKGKAGTSSSGGSAGATKDSWKSMLPLHFVAKLLQALFKYACFRYPILLR